MATAAPPPPSPSPSPLLTNGSSSAGGGAQMADELHAGSTAITDDDILTLHEYILDTDAEAIWGFFKELQEDGVDTFALCGKEAALEPLAEDHALNGIALTAFHRAALLRTNSVLDQLCRAHPKFDLDTRLGGSGFAPLHLAAAAGVTSAVSFLAANGACVDAPDAQGLTALHAAARAGHIDAAKLLVVKGASVQSRDALGRTPLHHAARHSHLQMVAFLLKRDVDPNGLDHKGQTALHAASVEGHAEVIDLLLTRGAKVDAQDADEVTPLILRIRSLNDGTADGPNAHSAQNGDCAEPDELAGVKSLIHHRGCDVTLPDQNGVSPLLAAVSAGRVDVLDLLLDAGSSLDETSKSGEGVLHHAGCDAVVKHLLARGADVHAADGRRNTVLHKYVVASDDVTIAMMTSVVDAGVCVDARNQSGETALHCATRCGRLEKVQHLVSHGADVNNATPSGQTALHFGLTADQVDTVLWLLGNPAVRPDAEDTAGNTPLSLAVRRHNLPVVDVLVTKKVNLDHLDASGLTPASQASRLKYHDVLQSLLMNGAKLGSEEASSSLLNFVAEGSLKIVYFLLEQGAAVDSDASRAEPPIICAVRNGHERVAELLMTRNCRLAVEDGEKRTPLHLVCIHLPTCCSLVSQMLRSESVRLDAVDSRGRTALHYALDSADCPVEVAVQLIQCDGGGAASLNTQDNDGCTPSHRCLKSGDAGDGADKEKRIEKVNKMLAEEMSVDVGLCDCSGASLLHYAARLKAVALARTLVARGAAVNGRDADTRTPLHYACANGDAEMTSLLVESRGVVNSVDQRGNSPLHLAVRSGDVDTVEALMSTDIDADVQDNEQSSPLHVALEFKFPAVAETLLVHEVNVTICDKHGRTALHCAAETAGCSIIQDLLAQGADVNSKDDRQAAPLHYSARNADTNVMQCLLRRSAGVDACDADGNAAIHLSAERGSYDHVNLLLSSGASVDLRNQCGRTALHLAAQQAETDLVELLVANEADVNVADSRGATPLFYAVACAEVEGALILLDQDADIQTPNADGDVPLTVAAKQQRKPNLGLMKRLVKLTTDRKYLEQAVRTLTSRSDIDVENTLSYLGLDNN